MSLTKTSNLKSKDIDVATRTLRPRKTTSTTSNSPSSKNDSILVSTKKLKPPLENEKESSPLIDFLPRRSVRKTLSKSYSIEELHETKDEESILDDLKLPDISEQRPKRKYRKKSLAPMEEVIGPRKRSKPICRLGCCPPGASHKSGSEVEDEDGDSFAEDDSEGEEFKPTKRTYRKQSFGETRGRPRKQPKSVCSLDSCCGALASSFVEIDLTLKRRLFRKKQNSLALMNDMATNSCPSSPASYLEIDIKRGKRVYRKKGFIEEDRASASSTQYSSGVSNVNWSPVIKKEILTSPESSNDSSFVRRSYRKRSLKLSCLKPLEPTVASPDLHNDNASPLPTVATPKRRIPKAPHNTPVFIPKPLPFPEDSRSLLPIQEKRGRGRPRKVREVSDEEWGYSSTTLSADTDIESQEWQQLPQSGKPRKSRLWEFPGDEEGEEEPISEYELMRQRNIQENLQMLRQIFMDSGLNLNENTTEENKPKKPYTRLPLPPPRPKSARLEVRRSTGLLDFSKFSRRISLD